MHFQYLVGLCCLRAHPDAVEMVLGDRVLDSASESSRDVDVTISFSDGNGQRAAFAGYEAKMERGALDQAKVEQLCIKLNDMPDLTMRAIVSASGFSDTAVKKARKHSVSLFEFRDWTEPVRDGFPEMDLVGGAAESLGMAQSEFRWIGPILIAHLNPGEIGSEAFDSLISPELHMLQADGSAHPDFDTLNSLLVRSSRRMSFCLGQTPEAMQAYLVPLPYPPNLRPDGPVGDPVTFRNLVLPIIDPIYFRSESKIVQLKSVEIQATLQWHYQRLPSEYKVLTDIENSRPFAAAAMTQFPGNPDALLAAILGPENALVRLNVIHLTDAQKNFIHRLRVRA